MAADKNHGFPSWYGWSVENWGTKWNTYYGGASLSKGELFAHFCTAWSQCSPVIAEIARMYPDAEFVFEFLDEGGDFAGRVPFGAHLRYLILGAPRSDALHSPLVLGCLQFSSPAWRMRARDIWIGWNDATRAKRLQQVICNSRFLILPQVQVKNLASHVLALALRTATRDWEVVYGLRPCLVETLVDPARFTGHCYRAANWIDVGLTTGRGRQDRQHALHDAHPKRIFLYPLTPNAQQKLRQHT
ncbi:DUF4338 domain-containing protein [Acidithiobacillus sp. MC6.1]|nr:DUF4338 domain-containing protein [Acidithiobacillus sp. MC6.1]